MKRVAAMQDYDMLPKRGRRDSDEERQVQTVIRPWGRRYLYVFGGDARIGERGSIERFDLDEEKWESIDGLMPVSGIGSGVVFFQGRVWLVGGYGEIRSDKEVYSYNTRTRVWGEEPAMQHERGFLGVAVLGGMIYAVGGTHRSEILNTVEVFEIGRGWRYDTPMLNGRTEFGIGVSGMKMFVAGGYHRGQNLRKTVEQYDLETKDWTRVATMNTTRRSCGFGVLGRSQWVVGGERYGTIECYIAYLKKWEHAGEFPAERCRQGFTLVVAKDRFYIIGGRFYNRNGLSLRFVDYFNPYMRTWSTLRDMTTGRQGAGAVALVQ